MVGERDSGYHSVEPSNPDTNGTEEEVFIFFISGVILQARTVLGERKDVLICGVSSFKGVLRERLH